MTVRNIIYSAEVDITQYQTNKQNTMAGELLLDIATCSRQFGIAKHLVGPVKTASSMTSGLQR